MKNTLTISLCFILTISLFTTNITWAQSTQKTTQTTAQNSASDKGIQFFKGSWKEALKKAEEVGKPIFVDAYTSWCGPCKKMSKQVFPNSKVGTFFNKHYVNYKIDVEKAEDGPAFRAEYGIKAFPTLLFINSSGKVLHSVKGFRDPNKFLLEGRKGLADKDKLAKLEEKYNKGERSADFLREYITSLWINGKKGSYQKIANDYLGKMDNNSLKETENVDLIYNLSDDIHGKAFQLMLANKTAFVEKFGKKEIELKIVRAAFESVKKAVKDKNRTQFDKAAKIIQQASEDPEDAEELIWRANMQYYQGTRDWTNYAKAAVDYLDEYEIEDAGLLNNIAWDFYKHVDDKELLAKAQLWAEESIAVKSSYHNNDTYAALLYKLGKRDAAILAAEKAILIAKETRKDYKSTQELLDKMIME